MKTKSVARTLEFTTITYLTRKEGTLALEESKITLVGDYKTLAKEKPEKVAALIKERNGGMHVYEIVGEPVITTAMYAISVDDFVKYAHPITDMTEILNNEED